jgi:hypothetical protein
MTAFVVILSQMFEPIVEFWSQFHLEPRKPNVHPKDADWMREHWQEPLKAPLYETWEDYIASERFGARDEALHLSLIPAPYMGNLRDAKVLLFIANPGFGDEDYYFEDQPGIREMLIRNLKQESNGDYPFFFLNPALAWSGGFRWWQRRLRPLIEKFVSKGESNIEVMKFLARNIAAVELFPYHSRDGSELKGIKKEPRMPSVLEARKFLARSSQNAKQLTVVLRAHNKWEDRAPVAFPDHHYHGPKQQTISLDPKFEIGKKILAWLER